MEAIANKFITHVNNSAQATIFIAFCALGAAKGVVIRMRKIVQVGVILALLCLVGGITAGCGQKAPEKVSGQPQTDGKYELRFVGTLPVQHHCSQAQDYFKKLVEEKSNGKVQIQVYPAGQLYTDKDLVDVVPRGGVDLAYINSGMWTGLVPELAFMEFLTLYKDADHWWRVNAEDTEVRKLYADALEKKANTKFLGWLAYGSYSELISKKPVKTMTDFKGMRIRAVTEYHNYFLHGIGATSSTISSAEVYQGLQRGVLDGVMTGPTSMVTRKLYESAKYVTRFNFHDVGFMIVASLDCWKKLPKDVQNIILEAVQETEKWCREESKKVNEKDWKTLEQMSDVKIYPFPQEELKKLRDAGLPPQIEKYKERIGDARLVDHLLAVVEKLR